MFFCPSHRSTCASKLTRALRRLYLCHLIRFEPVEAAQHMKAQLAQCITDEERFEVLVGLHEVLHAHTIHHIDGPYREPMHTKAKLLLNNELGSLQDLHISVLTELLERYPENPDYLYAQAQLRTKRWEFGDAAGLMQSYVRNAHGAAVHDKVNRRVAKELHVLALPPKSAPQSRWRGDNGDVVVSEEYRSRTTTSYASLRAGFRGSSPALPLVGGSLVTHKSHDVRARGAPRAV